MKAYIEAVIGAALICTAADMLAPEKWQGYIRIITGLIILSVILSPVSKLRGIDIIEDFEAPEPYEEYDERLMVADALKERIDADVNERLEAEFGITDADADTELELNSDNQIERVKSIRVSGGIPEAAKKRLAEVYGTEEVMTQ